MHTAADAQQIGISCTRRGHSTAEPSHHADSGSVQVPAPYQTVTKTKGTKVKPMNELLEILHEINPAAEFKGRTDLVDSGDLDSMSIVMLVSELNDEFGITIRVTDITPENFNSTENIMKLIHRLQSED